MSADFWSNEVNILFMDKVLLACMKEPVRGVEIFNVRLLRDLSSQGDTVTVPVHSSWVPHLKSEVGDQVALMPVAAGRKSLLNGMCAVWKLRKSVFDVLLLANVANGLLPALGYLRRKRIVSRCVLVAHREPSKRFLKHMKRLPTRVVSVNGIIAKEFLDEGGYELSEVYYGVTEADRFKPGSGSSDGIVRFCVLGQLDNAWKGADTAVAAFESMRAACDVPCELHLASFSNADAWRGDGVVPYQWMPAGDIPEFLGKMDIMLVPSRDEIVMRETFSQVIVQGMLCALPVIASDLPVLTEKLDTGGGKVFRDVEDLAVLMKALAESVEMRQEVGAKARETALARYVWDTAVFREKYLA